MKRMTRHLISNRNAVECALKAAPGWGKRAAHNRAQIVYYLAENLELRAEEFAKQISRSVMFDAMDNVLIFTYLAIPVLCFRKEFLHFLDVESRFQSDMGA